MKIIIAAVVLALAAVSLQADDVFNVATLDTSGNALNLIKITIPSSGSPTASITKSIPLPSGSEFLVRNSAGDRLYISAGGSRQLVDVNLSTGAATPTLTIGLPRRLQITSSTCLAYGVSPATGKPAFESSPLPTLSPAAVANPATTRVQDLTVLTAGADAYLASVREVSSTDHGEVHRLNASACPPTLVTTFDLGQDKAAYAIAPITATTAFVTVLGKTDVQIVDFTAATFLPAGIVNLPPKPRLVRRLDSLANRHYVIDQDGQISYIDSSANPPKILANIVAGPSPSVVLVDPAKKWLAVFDRTSKDARVFEIATLPSAGMVVPLTVPVNDAVMLP